MISRRKRLKCKTKVLLDIITEMISDLTEDLVGVSGFFVINICNILFWSRAFGADIYVRCSD